MIFVILYDFYYICENIIFWVMKRISLLLTLIILSISLVSAKGKVSYQGEVDLGYSYGIGKSASERVNLHTIHGIKVGKYFSTGIGTGFDDLREDMFKHEKWGNPITTYMIQPPDKIIEKEQIQEVLPRFDQNHTWMLPVVDKQNRYKGFISKSRILNAYREQLVNISQ